MAGDSLPGAMVRGHQRRPVKEGNANKLASLDEKSLRDFSIMFILEPSHSLKPSSETLAAPVN